MAVGELLYVVSLSRKFALPSLGVIALNIAYPNRNLCCIVFGFVLFTLHGCAQQIKKTEQPQTKPVLTKPINPAPEVDPYTYPSIDLTADDGDDDEPAVDTHAAKKLSGEWHWLGNLTPTETIKVDKPGHYKLNIRPSGWFEIQVTCIKGDGMYEAVGNRISFTLVQQSPETCNPPKKDIFISSLESAGSFRIVGDRLRLKMSKEKREMVFYRP